MFNQQYLICDWWFNVDCSLAESFYSINEEIAAEQAANSPDGDATALPTSYLPSYPDTPPTQVKKCSRLFYSYLVPSLSIVGKTPPICGEVH